MFACCFIKRDKRIIVLKTGKLIEGHFLFFFFVAEAQKSQEIRNKDRADFVSTNDTAVISQIFNSLSLILIRHHFIAHRLTTGFQVVFTTSQ